MEHFAHRPGVADVGLPRTSILAQRVWIQVDPVVAALVVILGAAVIVAIAGVGVILGAAVIPAV